MPWRSVSSLPLRSATRNVSPHCGLLRNVCRRHASTNQRIPCACHNLATPSTPARTRTSRFVAQGHEILRPDALPQFPRPATRNLRETCPAKHFCRKSQWHSASKHEREHAQTPTNIPRNAPRTRSPPRPPLRNKNPSL